MNNPFYYVHVWRGGQDKVIGRLLTFDEYDDYLHRGAKLWSFTGRLATVCVLSWNDEIGRSVCLDFATMFMKGSYVTIQVDLCKLETTTTNGNPPP